MNPTLMALLYDPRFWMLAWPYYHTPIDRSRRGSGAGLWRWLAL